MSSTRTLSSRTRILVVVGLAAAGLVGGVAGWAPAAQAGCYGTVAGRACLPATDAPVVVGTGDDLIAETRYVATRTAAKGIAALSGCEACTPGIVVPIGPVPIGPAGDEVRETLERVAGGLLSRDVRAP